MNENLTEKLRAIVADILQMEIAPGGQVDRGTHPVWDSLNHLRVVISHQALFNNRDL